MIAEKSSTKIILGEYDENRWNISFIGKNKMHKTLESRKKSTDYGIETYIDF